MLRHVDSEGLLGGRGTGQVCRRHQRPTAQPADQVHAGHRHDVQGLSAGQLLLLPATPAGHHCPAGGTPADRRCHRTNGCDISAPNAAQEG